MAKTSPEICWESLLSLAETIKKTEEPIDFCTIIFGSDGSARLNSFPSREEKGLSAGFFLTPRQIDTIPDHVSAAFQIEDIIRVSEIFPSRLPEEFTRMIKIYAPYCFAPVYARLWNRAVAVSHLAQTLDGRIATVTGDSKWIGTQGNFVHAHRMRALVDGVLIGSKTLVKDRPQLTVRHVAGKNPCPVIIGSSYEDLGYLLEARMDPLILIGSNDEVHDQRVKSLSLNRINGVIQSPDILKALYSEGISSVYIEGGSFTTSHFLEDGSIDVLQLHLSPLMLGSGINSFNLPVILNISSAIRFKYQIYIPVDNGMMFIGLPEFNSKEG